MHFMLKLVFFLFAIQPGIVYPLLDFYEVVAGRVVEVLTALNVVYTDFILANW